ncbi:MAG: HEAT repeat domain-containing protein [Desertimonas sp.]
MAIAGHTGDDATVRAGLGAADPTVRATALQALDRLGDLDDDTLTAGTRDPAGEVRRRAATLAARHPAIDLTTLLGDTEPAVAEAASWACGERPSLRDGEWGALLARATATGADADPLVREAAVAALGALGDDVGLDAILAATRDRPAIRRRAVLALAPFLGVDHPRAGAVRAALAHAATDRDWQVRQAAEDIDPGTEGDDADQSV